MPERFWLNAAHSGGEDVWRGGALRIDPYWFAENAANPAETLFAGLWALLRLPPPACRARPEQHLPHRLLARLLRSLGRADAATDQLAAAGCGRF
jgi:hypothetical protein